MAVPLQVLLGVGLAFLCFCLTLGCTLCWRKRKRRGVPFGKDPASERIIMDPSSPLPGGASTPIKQQYEEVRGLVLDYPTGIVTSLPDREPDPDYKHNPHGRASLPFIPVVPRASLAGRTKRILERRCTVSGDCSVYNEHGAHPNPGARPSVPSLMGTNSLTAAPDDTVGAKSKPRPVLRFTLFYLPRELTLTVTVLGVSGLPKKLGSGCDSYVKVYLLPRFMEPRQTSICRKSLNPEFRESFQFSGYTLEEIKCFTLRFTAYVKEFHNLKDTFVGEVLFACEQGDWQPHSPSAYTRELTTTKTKLKKCLSSQDVVGPSSGTGQAKLLGQLFILLQYQTLANRIKVMVRKAESLARLTRMPGSPDHYVIISLYQDDKVLSTKETKTSSGYNPVWNAPFLFDVPSGDIENLQLSLEFIVMQSRIYTRSGVLGRVVIGGNASETGRTHWREMSNRGHVESARWHTIQPDTF
ncbi:synaptotagmin-4-like isoform X2 [Chiloscyllium plagiosum]|uniref:synaptotagmin-4-like isoform X2 n=1 Tax=Chiloscyllium plagiosum TaxID=36176 RepID=UPI001CB84797|nr:synaptotagmin-4-like isoform X2 [Chiloscyllium plagiosum]XP_043536179.1 synaptotagmin-4-like isoform X2 [Chiloscyllium plagiosum]XP_043536180.1 synaptotagmin-4-like isoform X2 [Chiloscyllium plagiosum]